jgi:hypothetical protein
MTNPVVRTVRWTGIFEGGIQPLAVLLILTARGSRGHTVFKILPGFGQYRTPELKGTFRPLRGDTWQLDSSLSKGGVLEFAEASGNLRKTLEIPMVFAILRRLTARGGHY